MSRQLGKGVYIFLALLGLLCLAGAVAILVTWIVG